MSKPTVTYAQIKELTDQLLSIIEKDTEVRIIGFRFAVDCEEQGIQSVSIGTLDPDYIWENSKEGSSDND